MYANVRNNEIIDFNSKYLDEDITRVETTQEKFELYKNDARAVIYQDGEIIENPEYESIIAEEERQEKINDIMEKLNELDLKSIRAIRANETEYLDMYETQVIGLRAQLVELGYETVES